MDVEDDDIRFEIQDRPDHVRPGRRFTDNLVTQLLFESFFEKEANSRVILDDDNFELLRLLPVIHDVFPSRARD